MSRSNYSEDCDLWDLVRWRGAVSSAIRGKRGQAMLKELLAALDAMPQKRLIANELVDNGEYCTLGILGKVRGLPIHEIDPEDAETVADELGIAQALAREIMYENDEASFYGETPAQRWKRMRAWVADQVLP